MIMWTTQEEFDILSHDSHHVIFLLILVHFTFFYCTLDMQRLLNILSCTLLMYSTSFLLYIFYSSFIGLDFDLKAWHYSWILEICSLVFCFLFTTAIMRILFNVLTFILLVFILFFLLWLFFPHWVNASLYRTKWIMYIHSVCTYEVMFPLQRLGLCPCYFTMPAISLVSADFGRILAPLTYRSDHVRWHPHLEAAGLRHGVVHVRRCHHSPTLIYHGTCPYLLV